MKPDYWRSLDFFSPDKPHPKPLIIGCGNIGSYITFGLARMGVKEITVVDFDKVEPHNLPNQFFAESLLDEDVDILKVIAVKQTVELIIKDVNIVPIVDRIENADIDMLKYKAIFVCVDDMNVRKWIFSHLTNIGYKGLLVDARTGGEFANVFAIDMKSVSNKALYEQELWDNSDAIPLPCSGTTIMDVTFGVVGDCINKYRKYAKHKNIIITHGFHDYVVGTLSPMSMNHQDDAPIRNVTTAGFKTGDIVRSE